MHTPQALQPQAALWRACSPLTQALLSAFLSFSSPVCVTPDPDWAHLSPKPLSHPCGRDALSSPMPCLEDKALITHQTAGGQNKLIQLSLSPCQLPWTLVSSSLALGLYFSGTLSAFVLFFRLRLAPWT